jgi:hypothetical protein
MIIITIVVAAAIVEIIRHWANPTTTGLWQIGIVVIARIVMMVRAKEKSKKQGNYKIKKAKKAFLAKFLNTNHVKTALQKYIVKIRKIIHFIAKLKL